MRCQRIFVRSRGNGRTGPRPQPQGRRDGKDQPPGADDEEYQAERKGRRGGDDEEEDGEELHEYGGGVADPDAKGGEARRESEFGGGFGRILRGRGGFGRIIGIVLVSRGRQQRCG